MTVGELLLPVAAVLKRDLLEGGYIQADETPIGVQSEQTKGRNHQAYEFQYSRPGGPVVFDFCMSRAREGPAEFLRDYGGVLQCDGYQGYEKIGAPGWCAPGALPMCAENLTMLSSSIPKTARPPPKWCERRRENREDRPVWMPKNPMFIISSDRAG